MKSTVRAFAAPVLAALVLAASAPALAGGQANPDLANAATGTIEMSGGGVALGVGVSWARGR